METSFILELVGGERLSIPGPILEYFGLFTTLHEKFGVRNFPESPESTMESKMWQDVINALSMYTRSSKKYASEVSFLRNLVLVDLYRFLRVIDFYDIVFFLSETLQELMRRLLPMTTEQLYLAHPLAKRGGPISSPSTVYDAILPVFAEREATLAIIMKKYIGVAHIIDKIEKHFLPHASRLVAADTREGFVLTADGLFYKEDSMTHSGPDEDLFIPVGLENVVSVHMSASTTALLTSDGKIHYSMSIEGLSPFRTERLKIAPLEFVTRVACGRTHIIALTATGIYTWGANKSGCLGTGDFVDSLTPKRIVFRKHSTVKTVGAGDHYSALATQKGDLYFFGEYTSPRLGFTRNADAIIVPEKVKLPSPVESMFCGRNNIFVILRDGTLWAIGSNYYGTLGVGDTLRRPSPVQVTFFKPFEVERVFCDAANGTTMFQTNTACYLTGYDTDNFYSRSEKNNIRATLLPRLLYSTPDYVIDAAGGQMSLIIKQDGLFGLMLEGAPFGSTQPPMRVNLKIGHELYDIQNKTNKRRKIDTSSSISCHVCAMTHTLQSCLYLHQKSQKLFCSSVCLDTYCRPPTH